MVFTTVGLADEPPLPAFLAKVIPPEYWDDEIIRTNAKRLNRKMLREAVSFLSLAQARGYDFKYFADLIRHEVNIDKIREEFLKIGLEVGLSASTVGRIRPVLMRLLLPEDEVEVLLSNRGWYGIYAKRRTFRSPYHYLVIEASWHLRATGKDRFGWREIYPTVITLCYWYGIKEPSLGTVKERIKDLIEMGWLDGESGQVLKSKEEYVRVMREFHILLNKAKVFKRYKL